MSTERERLIGALGEQLRDLDDLWLVVLFGSRARGTASASSDVDLAVWAPGRDLLGLRAELSAAMGLDMDVVSLAEPDIPLLEEIVAHGIVVHEGRAGAEGEWRAKALSVLDLDGPWFARMRDAWLRRVAAEGV